MQLLRSCYTVVMSWLEATNVSVMKLDQSRNMLRLTVIISDGIATGHRQGVRHFGESAAWETHLRVRSLS
jgi:hypothetical protein